MPIPWLENSSTEFPPLDFAAQSPNGLLAVGGDLSVARLLNAYRHGIFPWYEEGQPVLWWSPDPRMVLRPEQLKIARSLRRSYRRHNYMISFDLDFSAVIQACAETRVNSDGTWITADMQQAYCELHAQGYAHSVEVWDADRLVGGLYGLAIGQLFFGESMFSRETDTSKLALAALAVHLSEWHFKLIDCQVISRHLQSLGAEAIARQAFSEYLDKFIDSAGKYGTWQDQLIPELIVSSLR